MDNNVKKHANKPRNEIRRADYAVTDPEWIKRFLAQGAYGVLATIHNQQPYATPVNYIYDEIDHALYFHGARVGRTRANLSLNPAVCFSVSQMGRLIPAESISEFGVEYKSVTVFGTASLITDDQEKTRILLALMCKYFPDHIPDQDYPLPSPDELARTAIYKITIEDWSAKQQAEAPDHPAAFEYNPESKLT